MYVLIVDDAKPKKEMLRMMLEKIFHNEQIHLSWATNFIDEQNRFQNRDAYSIILLDGDLKDIRGNGVDLIPFIREKLWLAGATIIMTTYDERLRTAANKAGVPLLLHRIARISLFMTKNYRMILCRFSINSNWKCHIHHTNFFVVVIYKAQVSTYLRYFYLHCILI